jgi:poly(A) polymerase
VTDRFDPGEQAWMTRPEVRAVLDALATAWSGSGPAARFVGGCVRDAIMGRAVGDIDLATPLPPEAVVAALKAAGLKAVPTGFEHGTVTAVADGFPIEVTTLRRDVETDGRRAVVAYTEDWLEDSARRDFRLNAIYADPDGALFDPQGGVEDARAGAIVFVGDPETRIREDYLRILRFFRFRAAVGRGPADPAGLAACKALANGMRALSVERVWKELKKLLSAQDPGPALQDMADADVLEQVLPEAIALDLVKALIALEGREGWSPDPMLRLAALMPRMELVAARARRRLKMSNPEGDRLLAWARLAQNPRLLMGRAPLELAASLYPLDRQAVLDRGRLAWALDAAAGAQKNFADAASEDDWRTLLAFVESWQRPTFPVSGDDVIAAGIPKGPPVGAAMKALEALWLKGGFKSTREQLLAALPHIRL